MNWHFSNKIGEYVKKNIVYKSKCWFDKLGIWSDQVYVIELKTLFSTEKSKIYSRWSNQ